MPSTLVRTHKYCCPVPREFLILPDLRHKSYNSTQTTSGFDIAAPINITGNTGNVFILHWDEGENPANGYQRRVRFRQGGAIVSHSGLYPANFIHVAGQIHSAGGSVPAVPYLQGPRYDSGSGSLMDGGVTIKFKYVVMNTGNVPLTSIVATDDVIGAIGTLPTLAVDASETWIATPF